MPDNAPNLEQIAGATPPIAPQPAPQPVPSLYDGLRVRLAPFVAAADAATGGALSTGATMAKNLGSQVKDIATDPTERRDFIHGTLVGMASGGEFGEDVPAIYEGLRVRKADTPDPSKLAKDAGLVYKDEAMKGSGVHQFEHPDHPNETMAVREADLSTPEDLKARMDAKLAEKPIVPKVDAETSLYHGTSSKFEKFSGNDGRGTATGNPTGKLGTFFTSLPEEAQRYVTDFHGGQGKVIEASVSLKKPYEMTMTEFNSLTTPKDLKNPNWSELESKSTALRSRLESEGYDGIVIGKGGRYQETVVFDPKNIEIKNIRDVSAKRGAPNASGESAASQEAINRLAAEKLGGVKRVKIDTRSGKESVIPPGVDAVDMKAGPWEKIVRRDAKGDTLLDKGAKVRDVKK